jgi:N-methylhydantoinase B
MSAGHFFDITILSPIFHGDGLISYAGSTIHHTNISGYGISSSARNIHEEGLWIPVLKLYEAGEPNKTLFDIIKCNVHTPDALMGDLSAQVSSSMITS